MINNETKKTGDSRKKKYESTAGMAELKKLLSKMSNAEFEKLALSTKATNSQLNQAIKIEFMNRKRAKK